MGRIRDPTLGVFGEPLTEYLKIFGRLRVTPGRIFETYLGASGTPCGRIFKTCLGIFGWLFLGIRTKHLKKTIRCASLNASKTFDARLKKEI